MAKASEGESIGVSRKDAIKIVEAEILNTLSADTDRRIEANRIVDALIDRQREALSVLPVGGGSVRRAVKTRLQRMRERGEIRYYLTGWVKA